MKQKINSSNLEKPFFRPHKISFKQAIQQFQISALKLTLEKKKIISIKHKLKKEWLERINIIPPHITPIDRQKLFRATDSFAHLGSFKHSKHFCYKRESQFNDLDQLLQNQPFQLALSDDQITRNQLVNHKSYERSTTGFQRQKINNFRYRKFKQNWKHSYRKDQINVLRYSTNSPVEAKLQKPSNICKMLFTMIQVEGKYKNQQDNKKMIYEKGPSHVGGKENIELKEEEKKEDKKYRCNLRRNNTSLLIKKPYHSED